MEREGERVRGREEGGRKRGEMMGGGTDGAKRRRAATYNWLQAQISDGARRGWEGERKKRKKRKIPETTLPSCFPSASDRPPASAARLISRHVVLLLNAAAVENRASGSAARSTSVSRPL